MCDECLIPVWKSDDGSYMLKVKIKWMPERDFEKNEFVIADLNLHYYSMEKNEELIQGYYVRLSTNDVIFETA